MPLEILWYQVLIIAMIAYSVLDGFDLGVGCLHLFAKKDQDRRIFLNAIGPVWDGNEVWLVIVIGALFAGFPDVYATLLSAFYIPVMCLLCGLIFRAAAIEFRSKLTGGIWRTVWDGVFCFSSLVITFGTGVILGNLVEGIPLDEHGDFHGTFASFFRPYTILVGITTIALFTMHGALYLVMKTEGKLHERLRRWAYQAIAFFALCYLFTTIATFSHMPHMLISLKAKPWLFFIPLAALASIASIPLLIRKKLDGSAFIASSLSIASLICLFAIGTYPTMIRSSINPRDFSLSVFNSASSPLTLKVLLLIVMIGIPLVLAYGVYIYRTFRGKVKIDKSSY